MRNFVTILIGYLLLSAANVQAETGVSRTAFTSAIENKEPVSNLQSISTGVRRVYFFTELTGLNGHRITHRWEYNGKVFAEVAFDIGGNRWRTWSSKNILPSWTGTWQVSVLDEGGNIIELSSFEYVESPSSVTVETAVNESEKDE